MWNCYGGIDYQVKETEDKQTDVLYEIANCEKCCDGKQQQQGAEVETENDRLVPPSLGWLVIKGRRRWF